MSGSALDRSIYENPVYKRRLRTDALLEMPFTAVSESTVYGAARFVAEGQLKKDVLWRTFAEQFAVRPDGERGDWKGEFWGKMMRGGCFVYRITRDEELYKSLKEAVLLLLDTAEPDGRISSYPRENEFFGWDMWCRKYVLLGLEYFYDICPEEGLKKRILAAMCAHLDYIIANIGEGEGKKSILETSAWWGCVNSCSILEPVVRLYSLTNEKRYFDFAAYIVSTGGCSKGNLLELALKNEIPPYKYPVVKAYEMMSFFEGVAEFYRVTGEEKYRTAVINFADAVLDTDYTIIGGCGCTHELFDNSSVVQTEERVEIMQETCVAVTLSKLMFCVYRLTGDPKYADAIETTYYNSILGSINFGKNDRLECDPALGCGDYHYSDAFVKEIGGFMFDSYSPLRRSSRNRKTGGYQPMRGGKAYGCCACIGAAGAAVLPLSAVMISKNGESVAVSQYIDGEFAYTLPSGGKLRLDVRTRYPYESCVSLNIGLPEGSGVKEILLRVPSYGGAVIRVRGEEDEAEAGGFFAVPAEAGTVNAELEFDLKAKITVLNGKAAVKKGCIVMAADCRNADIFAAVSKDIVSDTPAKSPFPARLSRRMRFGNGTEITLTDYASAGADWVLPERRINVWFDM